MFVLIVSARFRKPFQTVSTVIALANRKQGWSYKFETSTNLSAPCACFYVCLCLSESCFYASPTICSSVQNKEEPFSSL